MKRHFAGAIVLALPMLAHAQGSITLYGRIDNGIAYTSGVTGSNSKRGSLWSAESGNWGGSYIAMKGVEDISPNLHAVFHLEGALLTTTGQGVTGVPWNRWAVVGLTHDRYGAFLMGRELSISNDLAQFDPFRYGNQAGAILMRGRSWNKSSNNLSYQSPTVNGFDFYGQYALSNASNWNGNGSTTQGRQAGAQITYSQKWLQVRALYDEIRDPTNGKMDSLFTYSREVALAANVFVGSFKVQAAYQAAHADVASGLPSALQHEWFGVTWKATPAIDLTAAGYHVNVNHGGGNANFYALGSAYHFSKRTQVNIELSTVRNSRAANFDIADDAASSSTNTTGHAQTSAYLSINHIY